MSPSRLAGPLFDKELRVSSRRRRNYVLRVIYIIFLTFFVAMVWLSVVESQSSATYQKSRMEVAGKTIITTIVTFQFIATQLIAVVMLSTAISDEIYHRTLGLLMTTPISSFHIIMGKLFSKLLQIILLLAISLPLLAVVRVFGGVPWAYLLSSLCITLTAVIFAGSVSLYFSIQNRRAYAVIIKTVVTLGVLYVLLPMLSSVLFLPRWLSVPMFRNPAGAFPLLIVFVHLNPFGAMSLNTAMMISPAAARATGQFGLAPGGMSSFYWPLHCVLMLAASALVLSACVKLVRKTALRQATGQLEPAPGRRQGARRKAPSPPAGSQQENQGLIRRVKGSPVLWKELRSPIIQGAEGRNSIIGLTVAVVALLITYGVCKNAKCLNEDFTHVSYVLMFLLTGSVFNMVLSASCITCEKETRSWLILLATPIDDWHVLSGKAVGIFRRCLPFWLFLAGHITVFVLAGYIHPIALPHVFMLVTGLAVFLTGMGIYFSSRFRHTTSAVVAGFGMALFLWAVVPMLIGGLAVLAGDERILETYVCANPAAQAAVIMSGAAGKWNAQDAASALVYNWPNSRWDRAGATTGAIFVYMLAYAAVGFLFAWRAKCLFRRRIF